MINDSFNGRLEDHNFNGDMVQRSENYNLKVVHPKLASQWHPTKNGPLKPQHVTPCSGKKVWWLCERGHEWQVTISNRVNGRGCPYCSGRRVSKDNNLLVRNPELAKQWHPTKNGKLKPEQVSARSMRKVWWLCKKGHEWQAMVYSRCDSKIKKINFFANALMLDKKVKNDKI